MFWKEVNRVRKGGEERGEGVKGEDGEILQGEKDVGERWKVYFSELLNEGIEISNGGGIENGGEVVSEDQERNISKEEVEVAVRKVKKGKSAGMDGIYGEMIKEGPRELFDWLVRLFNVCWREGRVPQEWQDSCIVPLYKGKGDRMVCKNYRGISLLSVIGKIYGKVLVRRMKELTSGGMGEEQGGFREGRGCVDQVFTLRLIAEKLREKNKMGYVCFLDLEKAYDRVCRRKLFEILKEMGLKGKY